MSQATSASGGGSSVTIFDSFEGTSGTTLGDGTGGTHKTDTDHTWIPVELSSIGGGTVRSGSATITNDYGARGGMLNNFYSAGYYAAVIETGDSSSYTMELDFFLPLDPEVVASISRIGFVFRYTNSSNYLMAVIDGYEGNAGYLKIFKVEGGVLTLLAENVTDSYYLGSEPGTGDPYADLPGHLVLTVNGNNIQLKGSATINSSEVVVSTTSSFNTGTTKHGLVLAEDDNVAGVNHGELVDNFKFVAP